MLDLDDSLLLCSCEICSVMKRIICVQLKCCWYCTGKEKNMKKHYFKSFILSSMWPTLVWTTTPQMVREIAQLQGNFLLSCWVGCGHECVWVCVGVCEWQQDHPRNPAESERFWIPARIAQETDKGCPKSMQNQWQLTHLWPFFISFGDCLNTSLAVS